MEWESKPLFLSYDISTFQHSVLPNISINPIEVQASKPGITMFCWQTVRFAWKRFGSLYRKCVKICVELLDVFLLFHQFIVLTYNGVCCVFIVDKRIYDVILSYHFSLNDDLYAQGQTREVVSGVSKVLETLGYKVYDEHKHGTPGGKLWK